MNTKNCIIIGLIAVTALLTCVGCSTSNTDSTDLMTSGLAAKAPAMSALSGGTDPCAPYIPGNGTNNTCGGPYYGLANFTNSATGTVWFTPPAGTTTGTATDSSGIGAPYSCAIQVIRSDNVRYCGTNSVTFPATSAKKYKFVIYVLNQTPPPTNGQSLTLNIQWNP